MVVGGGGAAGENGDALFLAVLYDLNVQTGGDNKFAAGGDGLIYLLGGHDSACAHAHGIAQSFLDHADGLGGQLLVFNAGLVEGHFHAVDAVGAVSLGHLHDGFRFKTTNDGDDFMFQNGIKCFVRHIKHPFNIKIFTVSFYFPVLPLSISAILLFVFQSLFVFFNNSQSQLSHKVTKSLCRRS